MAAKKSMAEVAIQASGVTVEAGSQWFSGSSDGVLTWNLPSGAEHLFRALLWDEWVLDDQPGQTDCTTIRADGIDGFDLDGGSEHPRRWADGSSGEGFRPPANEVIGRGSGSTKSTRSMFRLKQMSWSLTRRTNSRTGSTGHMDHSSLLKPSKSGNCQTSRHLASA